LTSSSLEDGSSIEETARDDRMIVAGGFGFGFGTGLDQEWRL